MYKTFFGLQQNPFGMAPEPAYLFLTPRHREALAGLLYSIAEHKGFVVLIGDAGTGKTTLLARLLEAVSSDWLQTGVILNPTLTPSELLQTLLMTLQIPNIPEGKPLRLKLLEDHLLKADKQGQTCALIVDEAHKLTPELLEEIRLIGNMEHGSKKLLQIVLIGQESLGEVLNREDMRQLKQRIAVRLTLKALTEAEVEQYMRYRWAKAGSSAPFIFTNEALASVSVISKGIPRLINAVCDNALTLAYAQGQKAVTKTHIESVAHDLDLDVPVIEPQPAPVPEVKVAEPWDGAPIRMFQNGSEPEKRSILRRWVRRFASE